MPPATQSKPRPPTPPPPARRKVLAWAALLTSTPFLIAIAVHVLLLLLGGSIVIFKGGNPLGIFTSQNVTGESSAESEAPPSPEEPTAEPEPESMPASSEPQPVEKEESTDLLVLSTPTATPAFAPPAPAKTTGTMMGAGSLGSGKGTTPGTGAKRKARSGGTLFGFSETQEDDLIGTMIDLKLDSTGKKPTGIGSSDTDFYRAARDLLAGQRVNDGALRKYFTVPKKLGATQIFIPTQDAKEAPKVFDVADKVKPNYWIIRYKGRFSAPVSGQYRFVGKADDLLWVAVDGRTVLEAHWDVNNFLTGWRPKDHIKEHSIYDFMEGNTEGDRERAFLTYGDWMNLEAGKPKELEILLGEYGGGRFFAVLMIQEKGQEDKKGKSKDRPLIPLFMTAEPNAQQRQFMRGSRIEFPKENPVFSVGQTLPTAAAPEEPSPGPETAGRIDIASSYGTDWKDGGGANADWEGWVLRANGNPEKKSYAGFYLAQQEEKKISAPVATEGRSFAVYADGEGFQEAAAFRKLIRPLGNNQAFCVDFVTPPPKSNSGTSGSIGITLRSGQQAESPKDYNAGARFELAALEGRENYQIFDGTPSNDSGLTIQPGGVRLEFTLKSADTYDLRLSPLGGGSPVDLRERKLGGTPGSPIESLALFNRDSEQNAFFNRLRLMP